MGVKCLWGCWEVKGVGGVKVRGVSRKSRVGFEGGEERRKVCWLLDVE